MTSLFRHALLAAFALPAACGGKIGVEYKIDDPNPPPEENPPMLGRKADASMFKDASASDADLDASMIDVTIEDVTVPEDVTVDVAPPLDSGACATVEGPPDGWVSCVFTLTLVDATKCDFPNNMGTPEECQRLCGSFISYCTLVPPQGGDTASKVQCEPGCLGRRPDGLTRDEAQAATPLGRWFADAARLEAASVDAFRILRRELAHYGAPKRLRRAASRAAKDEVRHARTTRAIARRFGGRAKADHVIERPVRSLEAIALENAVEGCVNETFGAMLATYQATCAQDPGVRAAMKKIARDETFHAELAWEVAGWLEPRLSSSARERIREAQRAAIAQLTASCKAPPPREVGTLAGLPTPPRATKILEVLRETLWAA
jgi:hypothetical protein